MKKLILTASVLALIPSAASAQLLGGGGGLGGSLGGGIGGTIGSTVDSTTRTVRTTVDSTARGSTRGEQSVNARDGSVSASRSAEGSANASSASLADLPIPSMLSGSASGSGSANGNANAQLIGTDAVTGAVRPVTRRARETAGQAGSTARGLTSAAPTPGIPALGGASAAGEASGAGAGSLMSSPLAVAGSAAGQGNGAATVMPGMPVMTPGGASLGKVKEVVANGRGEVQQVVVKQGRVTRTLPAGMFSASGNALIAGKAQGEASGAEKPAPAGDTAE